MIQTFLLYGGPRMVQTERSLRAMTATSAIGVALLGAILLALAVVVEWQRRNHSGSRLVLLADRLVPAAARRIAVVLVGSLSTMAVTGAAPASADDSLRGWLSAPTTTQPRAAQSSDMRTTAEPADPPRSPVAIVPPAERAPTPTTSVVPTAPVEPSRGAPVITPPASLAPSAPPVAVAPSAAPVSYRVEPGDCLWSIAARVLGTGAQNAEIDRAWRAIYDVNQIAIGTDPNLIHPGLTLVIPALVPTR